HSLDRAIAWHKDLRATITRLDAAFKHWEVSPRLAAPWRHFTEGIQDHLAIEEEVLFPALRALAEGRDPGDADFETPLNEMQFELDELATISDALRNASPEAGELEGDLLTMLDQLDVHGEKEQSVIFPEGRAPARCLEGAPLPRRRACAHATRRAPADAGRPRDRARRTLPRLPPVGEAPALRPNPPDRPNSPMRLLLLIDRLDARGGALACWLDLLVALAERHEVRVATGAGAPERHACWPEGVASVRVRALGEAEAVAGDLAGLAPLLDWAQVVLAQNLMNPLAIAAAVDTGKAHRDGAGSSPVLPRSRPDLSRRGALRAADVGRGLRELPARRPHQRPA
ncbi:MAG: hemerythrin domain-containing protein, partial [Planctomycetes bacterium]|nr:hemerythrin domain-containing protein [Planctomycetota bacterium]